MTFFGYLFLMENNFGKVLEKFMNTMGITYTLEITRGYRNTMGRKNVCIEIMVKYKGEVQYIQHHCYRKVGDSILYTEGNEIMGIKDGVLAYLGNPKKVDEYFDRLGREMAKEYFEKDF